MAPLATVHRRFSRTVTADRWFRLLVACVAVAAGTSIAAAVVVDRPPTAMDPAFFQHVGWYVLQGATPYVDVWDVNPPLTFAVAAGLALLVGGDVLYLHVASAALTTAVAAGAVLLTGLLAYDLTGDDAAALAAGLAVLVVPEVYGLPPFGLRSQYFALLFGALGLVLARRDRPIAAGASAAVAAGFWQPGAGFALLVVGIATRQHGRAGAAASVLGGVVVAALVVLPFAVAGALVPMVVETVVAPLLAGAPYTLAGRAYAIVLALGYGAFVLPLAVYGWVRVVRYRRADWWVPAGALVFGFQMLFLNMDGSLDALPWLLFVALGVGIAVSALGGRLDVSQFGDRMDRLVGSRDPRWAVVAAIALLVLAGPVWSLAPAPPGKAQLQERHDRAQPPQEPVLDADDAAVPDVRTIYWESLRPETCHYRLSWTELRWIEMTGDTLEEERCGRWPGWDAIGAP